MRHSLLSAFLLPALLLLAIAKPATANTFTIDLTIGSGFSPNQIGLMQDAAIFWETVIVGYQDGQDIGGIDVTVSAVDLGGVSGVLAQAGPTQGLLYFDERIAYTTLGSVQYDIADIPLLSDQAFFDVMVHELAHVIGFGTLWDFPFNGIVFNDVLNDVGDYIGESALTLYQALDLVADAIPTVSGEHWAETSALGSDELLTPFIAVENYVSDVTLASFEDIGYIVDFNALAGVSAVPLPASAWLLLTGIGAMICFRGRRRRADGL